MYPGNVYILYPIRRACFVAVRFFFSFLYHIKWHVLVCREVLSLKVTVRWSLRRKILCYIYQRTTPPVRNRILETVYSGEMCTMAQEIMFRGRSNGTGGVGRGKRCLSVCSAVFTSISLPPADQPRGLTREV